MSKSPLQGSLTADRGIIAPLNSRPPISKQASILYSHYLLIIAVRSCLPTTILYTVEHILDLFSYHSTNQIENPIKKDSRCQVRTLDRLGNRHPWLRQSSRQRRPMPPARCTEDRAQVRYWRDDQILVQD